MSNLVNVVLAIFIIASFQGIECNPLHAEKEISGGIQRSMRVFKPDKKEWVHFHHSWGLPHFPSLTSVSNLFQDEEDTEKITTQKRLEALEKNQKEILAILQKLSNEMTTQRNQTKLQPLKEKPQTSTLDNKTPTSQPSIEKEVTTKKIETEYVSSTVPSTISTSLFPIVSSSAPSMIGSTLVTRIPVVETSTVQDTTLQPQSSPSSEEPRLPTTDQNENANLNSNLNTTDNEAATNSAVQQTSPSDTNSGSIVAFTADENKKGVETTESSA